MYDLPPFFRSDVKNKNLSVFFFKKLFSELDFDNSDGISKKLSPLNTTQQQTSFNNINQQQNIIQNNLSPEEAWGPPLFAPDCVTSFDEQLLSPINTKSTNESKMSPTNHSDLFASNEEEIINFNEYESPALTFDDEFQKFGQAADDQYKGLVKSYEESKPLPVTLLPVDSNSAEDDEEVALDTANTMGSQGPTMNPTELHKFSQEMVSEEIIYPTPITINDFHNYTSIKEENNMVEDVNRRRVPHLKLKLPKPVMAVVMKDTEVSTPQITNEIIAMETEFDLVSYITNVSEFNLVFINTCAYIFKLNQF